ncbi:Hypothetical predicted protein [Mytilus galloprovincialis]|uniref:Uncharacterized protein n=1 Tax=Mytilus galloprovincialis TaxID=29158 RepID=A0A8B6H9K7_MYTGA|nr:Hypothetical predicted protein [Mytilus galloprovincialis]
MKPQKRNRQPPNSLRSGAEKKSTSKRKRPNVCKIYVHSDPKRPMAPRGNQHINAAGSHPTQVMVNESADEIIASNQNQSDRAELDPVTVAIPGPSSSRVSMSSTDSQRPELYDVATTIHRRADDNDSSIVSQVEMVPSIQDSHGSHSASNEISLVNHIPESIPSIFDPIGAHIPIKIKEKIWRGEFLHLCLLLKSAAVLGSDSTLDGDFVLKGGALTVVNKKPDYLNNIEIWTSAFMIYMAILLENGL